MPDRSTRLTDDPDREPDEPTLAGLDLASAISIGARRAQVDLASDESLLVVLRGIGAVMFLTTRRLIVARDGWERRPRTGVIAFDLDAIRHLHLEIGSAPSGRIAVWTNAGQEAVSMFFDARSLDRAHQLINSARPQIARQRRRGPGARPARPPSGPADSGIHGPPGTDHDPPGTDRDDDR